MCSDTTGRAFTFSIGLHNKHTSETDCNCISDVFISGEVSDIYGANTLILLEYIDNDDEINEGAGALLMNLVFELMDFAFDPGVVIRGKTVKTVNTVNTVNTDNSYNSRARKHLCVDHIPITAKRPSAGPFAVPNLKKGTAQHNKFRELDITPGGLELLMNDGVLGILPPNVTLTSAGLALPAL